MFLRGCLHSARLNRVAVGGVGSLACPLLCALPLCFLIEAACSISCKAASAERSARAWASAARRSAGGEAAASAAGRLPNTLGNVRGRRAHNHVGQCAGQRPPERVAGDGRIQPNAGDDGIRLSCDLYEGQDQHDPQKYIQPAWHCGEDGQKHFEEDHIGHHQKAHGAVHSAPAAEDVRGAFAAAHGKCQRRRHGEYGEDNIPLRNFQQEPECLEYDNNTE